MAHRRRQRDVAHAVAPNLRARHFDAALIADYAFITDSFVFAAITLPVLLWPKYSLTEKTVTLWLERAVIYRLRLGHFPMRPSQNVLRRGQADTNRIEVVNFEHFTLLVVVYRPESSGALSQ